MYRKKISEKKYNEPICGPFLKFTLFFNVDFAEPFDVIMYSLINSSSVKIMDSLINSSNVNIMNSLINSSNVNILNSLINSGNVKIMCSFKIFQVEKITVFEMY